MMRLIRQDTRWYIEYIYAMAEKPIAVRILWKVRIAKMGLTINEKKLDGVSVVVKNGGTGNVVGYPVELVICDTSPEHVYHTELPKPKIRKGWTVEYRDGQWRVYTRTGVRKYGLEMLDLNKVKWIEQTKDTEVNQ